MWTTILVLLGFVLLGLAVVGAILILLVAASLDLESLEGQ